MSKGIFTETEFKEALSNKIREINEKEAAQAKEEAEKLATPTPAEVNQVEQTKAQ